MTETRSRFTHSNRSAQAQGVLLVGLGVFVLISMVSYSPGDYPNAGIAPGDSSNWGGQIGARIAYAVFLFLGYAGYVLPALALLWGGSRLRGAPVAGTVQRTAGLLSVALLLSIASGLPHYSSHTAFRLGGWLGIAASDRILIPYVGRPGSWILLVALGLASFILGFDIQLARLWHGLLWGLAVLRRICMMTLSLPVDLLHRIRAGLAARQQRARARDDRDADQEQDFDTDDDIGPGEDREDEWDEEEVLVVAPPAVREPAETAMQIGGLKSGDAAAGGGLRGDKTEPEQPAVERASPSPTGADTAAFSVDSAASAGVSRKPRHDAAQAPEERSAPLVQKVGAGGGRAPAPEEYQMPSVDLLDEVPSAQGKVDENALRARAQKLEQALSNFDVSGKVVEVSPGPVVTRYEVEPAAGIKVNRIVTLSDDLARVMSANGIRIQAPVPGKSVVGVEIANEHRETVYLREILEAKVFRQSESRLTMALGKTISGQPYVADLTRMPHLLVAGATGAGKSVCINGLICSLLYKSTPEQVRLLLVDPKVVELTMYNGIPHLLVPVVTEPKKAAEALRWAVAEMEARYTRLACIGVRNLADYNRKAEKLSDGPDGDGGQKPAPMPYIVIVIDEFADLMLTAPAEVETSLMALAQKSRAVGIHIILATQRPSVNVITGVIKANFPSRIAFQVATKTDSRTILDMNGAERLLGRGDMLFLPGGQGEPVRVHGAYVSSEETEALVEALRASPCQPEEVPVFGGQVGIASSRDDQDELFDEAARLVIDTQQASTSFLQRRMKVGYSRAARLMDELESAGIVGPAEGARPRQILVNGDALDGDGEEA